METVSLHGTAKKKSTHAHLGSSLKLRIINELCNLANELTEPELAGSTSADGPEG